MSGAAPATRKPDAVISATATGRASPPATIRLRVTSRQAPSSVTDRSVSRQTTKSYSARGSSSFVGDVPVEDVDDALAGGQRQ